MGAFVVIVLVVGVLVTWLAGRATREEFHLYVTEGDQLRANRLAPLLAGYYEARSGWDGIDDALTIQFPGPPRIPENATPFFRNRTEEPHGRFGMMERMVGGINAMGGMDMLRVLGTRAIVADPNGEIVADTAGELAGRQVDASTLAAGAPIWSGEEQIGTVWLTSGEPSAAQNERFLANVNRATLLAAMVASVVALILGGLITWGVTRPMQELTRAAEAIAAGDMSRRVQVEGADEVGNLATAFNKMAAELERAEVLRRQMTADIAHELRTPLSVIRGNVEALQDGVFPLTTEALEPIQAKTKLLSRLVEDLRELALAESGHLPLDREATDLAALTRRTAAAFHAAAAAKSISLEVAIESDRPMAHADPQRIEQVLANLLANALYHTPDGGSIAIRVSSGEPGWLIVWVSDTGPGIPVDALPNVFERFYRADRGRARGTNGEGSGLGLAVARSIVEAHGGAIGVDSPPGQGASFWFSLPLWSHQPAVGTENTPAEVNAPGMWSNRSFSGPGSCDRQ